jgi:hypothetical protein
LVSLSPQCLRLTKVAFVLALITNVSVNRMTTRLPGGGGGGNIGKGNGGGRIDL